MNFKDYINNIYNKDGDHNIQNTFIQNYIKLKKSKMDKMNTDKYRES